MHVYIEGHSMTVRNTRGTPLKWHCPKHARDSSLRLNILIETG